MTINSYSVLTWVTINGHFLWPCHLAATWQPQGHLGVSLASSPLNWLYGIWSRSPACGWGPTLRPWEGKEMRRRRSVCVCVGHCAVGWSVFPSIWVWTTDTISDILYMKNLLLSLLSCLIPIPCCTCSCLDCSGKGLVRASSSLLFGPRSIDVSLASQALAVFSGSTDLSFNL